ncbi:hypothetical protein OEV98_04850 [Caldibacillus lycopersici]|uniref:Uncharacterized protein n=1 Tax=Perspicuibacillus lycopersici TaxID=1325689 RepID=A0AAE3IR29_9BACI|nr:hypothetical protein [Perspicuibacillus lycopersici]
MKKLDVVIFTKGKEKREKIKKAGDFSPAGNYHCIKLFFMNFLSLIRHLDMNRTVQWRKVKQQQVFLD